MSKPDGGPAFPHQMLTEHGAPSGVYHGMTLRDYMAAQALQGILARGTGTAESMAIAAYAMADLMLAEREQSE